MGGIIFLLLAAAGILSGLRMYYGAGDSTYVYVSDPLTASEYSHYEEALTAPASITTAAAATTLAQATLARRKFEERNINVSIGPLTIEQAILVKYGQLIDIKARAIAFADDNFFTGRIRQLRWTTPAPDMFFAHMMIDHPVKDVPYGVGNKSGSEAVGTHMTAGSNSHPEFVPRALLTTQGDLPYRGASDWTRLPIGGSNTHLTSNGSVPSWIAQPVSAGTITVKEVDGTPNVSGVSTVRVSNGTLTDDGAGQVTVNTGGGSNPNTVDLDTAGSSVSSTSFADSNMAVAVSASTNYLLKAVVFFNTNATSVGIRLAFTFPAGATLKAGGYNSTGAGGANDQTVAISSTTAADTAIFITTTGPGATNSVAVIEGTLQVAGTAGTLTLRHASETATATSIEAGSYLMVTAI